MLFFGIGCEVNIFIVFCENLFDIIFEFIINIIKGIINIIIFKKSIIIIKLFKFVCLSGFRLCER